MPGNSLSRVSKTGTVGGDLIASLSMGLYSNPLEVYRELVQNATDAYQINGTPFHDRRIDIGIDRMNRKVSFQDYATGLSKNEMTKGLFAIGNSRKRGKQLRGFRGIGRLSALGYCKELVFRSRKSAKEPVWQITWDSIALHRYLNQPDGSDIGQIFKTISKVSELKESREWPERFFECELNGVRANKNDIILNSDAVSTYLSEIAPVEFRADFSFAQDIYTILGKEAAFEVKIFINDSEECLTRPHSDRLTSALDQKKIITTIDKVMAISELDDGFETMAKGWILHHDYPGALPQSSNIRGLRIRVGNIQVGDERILEHLFKESRFNSWCIGEIHIVSTDIRPNTRRDNLELCPALDNLENSLRILTKNLIQICRDKSAARNQKSKNNHKTINVSKARYQAITKQLGLRSPLPDKITLYPKKYTRN